MREEPPGGKGRARSGRIAALRARAPVGDAWARSKGRVLRTHLRPAGGAPGGRVRRRPLLLSRLEACARFTRQARRRPDRHARAGGHLVGCESPGPAAGARFAVVRALVPSAGICEALGHGKRPVMGEKGGRSSGSTYVAALEAGTEGEISAKGKSPAKETEEYQLAIFENRSRNAIRDSNYEIRTL